MLAAHAGTLHNKGRHRGAGTSPRRARLPGARGPGRAARRPIPALAGPRGADPTAGCGPGARGAGASRLAAAGRAGPGRGGEGRGAALGRRPGSGPDKGGRAGGCPRPAPRRGRPSRPPPLPGLRVLLLPESPSRRLLPPGRAALTCGRRARLGPGSRLTSAPSPSPPWPPPARHADRHGRDTVGCSRPRLRARSVTAAPAPRGLPPQFRACSSPRRAPAKWHTVTATMRRRGPRAPAAGGGGACRGRADAEALARPPATRGDTSVAAFSGW